MDRTARQTRLSRWLARGAICAVAAGCAKEPPPPSVNRFLDDRILLEATIVRCSENRSELKYTAECLNAREAANRIEAAETADRRKELEAQFDRKRQALRRAQEAAAEARRRAAEAERLREEARLLGQYPADGTETGESPDTAMPDESGDAAQPPGSTESAGESPPASSSDGTSDLESVREELRRRQEQDDSEQQQ